MVILDTNIIIDHLRQSKDKKSLLYKITKDKPKEVFAISIISIQELYEGRSTKNEEKERDLLATIAPLKVLSYTYEASKMAGEIARDLDRPIQFADAAIAATAILNGAHLLTFNKKDFQKIKGLELY